MLCQVQHVYTEKIGQDFAASQTIFIGKSCHHAQIYDIIGVVPWSGGDKLKKDWLQELSRIRIPISCQLHLLSIFSSIKSPWAEIGASELS